MLTHGIDLHKRDLVIATVDAAGVEVGQKRVRACEADVLRYFSGLPGPHRAVVERSSRVCFAAARSPPMNGR
jgi:hypothetical protein